MKPYRMRHRHGERSGELVLLRNQDPDPRTGKEWVQDIRKRFPKLKWRYKPEAGKKGVTELANGRYKALITIKGKRIHLGFFPSAEEAGNAYKKRLHESIYRSTSG